MKDRNLGHRCAGRSDGSYREDRLVQLVTDDLGHIKGLAAADTDQKIDIPDLRFC